MVIILVLLTFALFITINLIIASRKKPLVEAPITRTASFQPNNHPQIYFHPGHCWAFIQEPKLITIGVDDFVPSFLGKIDKVYLPTIGSSIRQGEPLVELHHGNKTITLVSPISGIPSEVNRSLSNHPELLNESPLSKGWLLKMFPHNLKVELRNLINSSTANIWKEALRTQLVLWFTPRVGPVLQDGGKLIDNFSDTLSDAEWQQLQQIFFSIDIQKELTSLKPLNEGYQL